jgi:hypothetical protein
MVKLGDREVWISMAADADEGWGEVTTYEACVSGNENIHLQSLCWFDP